MFTWLKQLHQLTIREYGTHRVHAPAQSLADYDDVWADLFMLTGKQLASTPQAGLNLVSHEEDVASAADVPHLAQIASRRNDYTGFPLDGLQQHRRCARGYGPFEHIRIAIRHGHETRSVGAKVLRVEWLR